MLALSCICLVQACGGGGGPVESGPAGSSLPPIATPDVNIPDPTLTVALNNPVVPGGGMTLVWSDEFDGSQLNLEKWFVESGDGSQYGIPGWGNNELQYYEPGNLDVRDGTLRIAARRERSNGFAYTSSRISTRDRFAFRYGRIEARIRLPGGQGLWPAFWLLPQDPVYGGWAASGEIDIMEAVNLGAAGGNEVHGTLHYGGPSPDNTWTNGSYVVPGSTTDEFHSYSLEWDEAEMRWYVDGVMYQVQNSWYTTAADFPAPFDQPFYVLLNAAVGGNWPGAPDDNTAFPAVMEIDYVRVYSGF